MTASTTEPGLLQGLSDDIAGAVERAGQSVVAVNARRHVASSGIHWQDGVVVTADHTLEREDDITVTTADGTRLSATVAGRDSSTDIAVLRAQGLNVPAAERADQELRVGHIVLAVARPGDRGLSASLGSVSALSGAWRTWTGGQIDQLIQPDLTLYPGFSGGPLIDGAGRVTGMNTSGLSRNMTLAIPVSTVERVAAQLLKTGRIARGFLGLGMQPVRLPDGLKQSLGLPSGRGLVIVAIESGGPAERAGLLVGDILVQLGETPVGEPADVQQALGPETVGHSVTARLIRAGQVSEIAVTVGERPQRGG